MMFEVRVSLKECTLDYDDAVVEAAGQPQSFSGGGITGRDFGWELPELPQAVAMRSRLEAAGFPATIREAH